MPAVEAMPLSGAPAAACNARAGPCAILFFQCKNLFANLRLLQLFRLRLELASSMNTRVVDPLNLFLYEAIARGLIFASST